MYTESQIFMACQLNSANALVSVIQGQADIMLRFATMSCSSLSVIFTKHTICVHYILTAQRHTNDAKFLRVATNLKTPGNLTVVREESSLSLGECVLPVVSY